MVGNKMLIYCCLALGKGLRGLSKSYLISFEQRMTAFIPHSHIRNLSNILKENWTIGADAESVTSQHPTS